MSEYRYEIPTDSQDSNWDQMSPEAQHVLIGRSAIKPANELLEQPAITPQLHPEVESWLRSSGDIALEQWKPYAKPGSTIETLPTVDDLIQKLSHHKITRLYKAQREFKASGLKTPYATDVGGRMALVAIPWQHFLDNLPTLSQWVRATRLAESDTPHRDVFNGKFINFVQNNTLPMYKDPNVPNGPLLFPADYLRKQIAQDGQWGLMLMQARSSSGVASKRGWSPEQLRKDGFYKELGYKVDNLGIFEWLALTLQEASPWGLNDSWLLANEIEAQDGLYTPSGCLTRDTQTTLTMLSDKSSGDIHARLAVA